MIETDVPQLRIRTTNQQPLNESGKWVVYWMTAFRRTRYNFALEYARDWAKHFGKPLIILEALRVRYRWASDRLHRFIIQGMQDNAADLRDTDANYYPYVEPKPGAGRGLLKALSDQACLIVTDDYPCFFHPTLIRVSSKAMPVRMDAVDSNCLMPLAVAERTFTVAHSYRRWMQKELPKHLAEFPDENPLDGRSTRGIEPLADLPTSFTTKWPTANFEQLLAPNGLQHIPIDHSVGPGITQGGTHEAQRLLERFINQRMPRYDEDRNEPDEYGSSELSPFLHFGHIAPHEVFDQVMQAEKWTPERIGQVNGKVNGFWGVSEDAEAFLDQLCSWREIGFNMCWREPNFDRIKSLPEWTQTTIAEHRDDERPYIYTLEEFERAKTHDPIWNAAQRQLTREGRIHNYMRMLWGKKILHWSRSVEDALEIMVHLNNKYGLDGRDPNSYSGIFWVLGRYDRAWGPERPVFGKIRYMTSENTAKKHRLKEYLKRYAANP